MQDRPLTKLDEELVEEEMIMSVECWVGGGVLEEKGWDEMRLQSLIE